MVNPYRTLPPVTIERTPWWKRWRCRLGWHPWRTVPFMRVPNPDREPDVAIMLHQECRTCGRLRDPAAAVEVFLPPSDLLTNMVRKRTAAHQGGVGFGYLPDGTDLLGPSERAIYNSLNDRTKQELAARHVERIAAHMGTAPRPRPPKNVLG